MRTINLIFAVHLHQPVGNFESVFEFATNQSYLPLLKELRANPRFRFSLHASGPLWEYWELKFPQIFDLVAEMVSRDQLELLGGGFYEPILAVIPRRDALAQLTMMSDFLHDRFGKKPRGIWLTERIWEPHLPSLLTDAGVEFTITDDYHFKSIGITGDKLFGHFVTEDSGKMTDIFPVSEDLRYLIPFSEAEQAVEFLINNASEEKRLLVFGDDGEKFGLWPGTNKWVWEEGWMRKFISGVISNSDIIRLHSFENWREMHAPKSIAYLPTISYFEMSEWTLPANLSAEFALKVQHLRDSGELEKWRPFLKGGFWRGFLAKYPESGWMHKRMFRASSKVLESGSEEAKPALHRSQCNCAYWHGVFGGLYLPHLRRGIFDNIIRAERLSQMPSKESVAIERYDLDCDGSDEVVFSTAGIQVFIKPSDGGKIYEIDLLDCERNVIDTLSRRPEGYHHKVKTSGSGGSDGSTSIHDIVNAKEADLDNLLHYDRYNRRFLVDHILPENLTPQEFRDCNFEELSNLASSPYDIILGPENTHDGAKIVLRKNFELKNGTFRVPFSIEKTFELTGSGDLFVEHRLKNQGDCEMNLRFASEVNFSLMSRDNPSTHLSIPTENLKKIRPGEIHEFAQIGDYRLVDEYDGFEIEAKFDGSELWMFPIETVSNSESGFERVYQETCLVNIWTRTIPPGGTSRITQRFNFIQNK